MAKPIEYLSGARIDFDESFDWYAERSIGSAIGFALAVDGALDNILDDQFGGIRRSVRPIDGDRWYSGSSGRLGVSFGMANSGY